LHDGLFPACLRHLSVVARILIFEPHGDIRTLLEIVINRLGHEAVVSEVPTGDLSSVDAAVIDPGDGDGLSLARRLRRKGVPIVFTSIFPAGPDVLDLAPTAYLIKPFALYSLEKALASAVAPARASAGA
jgi:DNA-binding response OmpR family regulator